MKQSPFINPDFDKKFITNLQEKTTKVKKMVLESALRGIPKDYLDVQVKKICDEFKDDLGDDFKLKEDYAKSFQKSAFKWNNFIYASLIGLGYSMSRTLGDMGYNGGKNPLEALNKAKEVSSFFKEPLTNKSDILSEDTIDKVEIAYNGLENVYQGENLELASDELNKEKIYFDSRYVEDATNLENYEEEMKKRILALADSDAKSETSNIELRRKIEIDLRLEHQIEMVNNLAKNGHDLCFLSTHSNCSKRCEKWQGKLVSLTKPSVNGNFETGDVIDGIKVYSFQDITNQVDKWGYRNNIIVGFNCRHTLVPYVKGEKPPRQYDEVDIKKERKVNDTLRAMERKIVKIKERAYLLESIDYEQAKMLERQAKLMTNAYKRYARENHFPYFPYRIKIYK